MKSNKPRISFKKSILYKRIGILIVLLSIIPIGVIVSTFTTILTIIILLIGLFFIRQYKCPYCRYSFDPRIWSSSLKHCPNCGAKLIDKH